MARKKVSTAEETVRNIRRKTRKKYSGEEKIRIVLEGLRGEQSVAELCRREGISESLYYGWVILILVLVTEIGLFQRIFDTESLSRQQWGICLVAAVFFLFVSEIVKLVMRLFRRQN